MNNALVSVLIPAFKPRWLGLAIESALKQTYQNLEILISDDSSANEVYDVVSQFQDTRIRYCKNPNRGLPGANRDFLISKANGQYVKFLFDDDFLLPRSIEILLEAIQLSGCKLAFHNRHVVDEHDQLIHSPAYLTGSGYAVLSQDAFFQENIAKLTNNIGEPSNILVETAALRSIPYPFSLEGRRMRFLTDMALYTNFAAWNLGIVAAAEFGSAFRKHSAQTSGKSYPGFSAGLFEWEMLRRWSVDMGLLSSELYQAGVPYTVSLYRSYAQEYPELSQFITHNTQPHQKPKLMSEDFCELLSLAYVAIELRKLSLH